jgi:hypothetical protein
MVGGSGLPTGVGGTSTGGGGGGTQDVNLIQIGGVALAYGQAAMAASILVIHVLGDILSPILIGLSADAFHDQATRGSGGRGLVVGMMSLPLALAVSAVLWRRGSRAPGALSAQT